MLPVLAMCVAEPIVFLRILWVSVDIEAGRGMQPPDECLSARAG